MLIVQITHSTAPCFLVVDHSIFRVWTYERKQAENTLLGQHFFKKKSFQTKAIKQKFKKSSYMYM